MTGALQLVHFGAALTAEPATTIHLIDACAALARAHVQLPNSDPNMLGQVLTSGCQRWTPHVQAFDKAHAVLTARAAVSETNVVRHSIC